MTRQLLALTHDHAVLVLDTLSDGDGWPTGYALTLADPDGRFPLERERFTDLATALQAVGQHVARWTGSVVNVLPLPEQEKSNHVTR